MHGDQQAGRQGRGAALEWGRSEGAGSPGPGGALGKTCLRPKLTGLELRPTGRRGGDRKRFSKAVKTRMGAGEGGGWRWSEVGNLLELDMVR